MPNPRLDRQHDQSNMRDGLTGSAAGHALFMDRHVTLCQLSASHRHSCHTLQEGHHQTEGPRKNHTDRQSAPQGGHTHMTDWEKQQVLIGDPAHSNRQQHSWRCRLIQRLCMFQCPLGGLLTTSMPQTTFRLQTIPMPQTDGQNRLQWTGSLKPRLSTLWWPTVSSRKTALPYTRHSQKKMQASRQH